MGFLHEQICKNYADGPKHACSLPSSGGGADCIADAHSAGPRQRRKVAAWRCSKTGCLWPICSRKSSLETPSGCQNGALSDPRGFRNRPKWPPGPFWGAGGAEGEKERPRDPHPWNPSRPVLTFQAALGAPRFHFGSQAVPQNAPKSTSAPRGAKMGQTTFQRGVPKWGRQK